MQLRSPPCFFFAMTIWLTPWCRFIHTSDDSLFNQFPRFCFQFWAYRHGDPSVFHDNWFDTGINLEMLNARECSERVVKNVGIVAFHTAGG